MCLDDPELAERLGKNAHQLAQGEIQPAGLHHKSKPDLQDSRAKT